jgi:hypothetical protein
MGIGGTWLPPERKTSAPLSDAANCAAPAPGFVATPSSTGIDAPLTSSRSRSNGAAKSVPFAHVQEVTAPKVAAVVAALVDDLPRPVGSRCTTRLAAS